MIRRQCKGIPMGLECAPQLANLFGYRVESRWVETANPTNVMSRRFIDDIFVAGPEAMVGKRDADRGGVQDEVQADCE